jgi:hypothetical protein
MAGLRILLGAGFNLLAIYWVFQFIGLLLAFSIYWPFIGFFNLFAIYWLF